MKRFNRDVACAAAAMPAGSIRSCTDVTGFGLAGHASEIASASGVSIEIDAAALPVLPGAAKLAAENLPCGGRANARHFNKLAVGPGVDPALHLLCLDPQTSGGILASVDPMRSEEFLSRLATAGGRGWRIGRVGTWATDLVTLR
jgi:selenide,water dikinase